MPKDNNLNLKKITELIEKVGTKEESSGDLRRKNQEKEEWENIRLKIRKEAVSTFADFLSLGMTKYFNNEIDRRELMLLKENFWGYLDDRISDKNLNTPIEGSNYYRITAP